MNEKAAKRIRKQLGYKRGPVKYVIHKKTGAILATGMRRLYQSAKSQFKGQMEVFGFVPESIVVPEPTGEDKFIKESDQENVRNRGSDMVWMPSDRIEERQV